MEEKTKLSNNIVQSTSMTLPGNPDIKFPPESGNYFPYSRDGKIDSWKEIPQENSIATAKDGQMNFIPTDADGILVVRNGTVTIIPAPSGGLSLFNNSLEWTPTTECT